MIGKVFVVMLSYRPVQRLSDVRSINLNLSDHVRFSRENMTLAVCKNRKNRACFICDHIEYKLQRYVTPTMIDTWSSSVLAKIFIIDGVAESVLFQTRPRFVDVVFRHKIKPLPKSVHLVQISNLNKSRGLIYKLRTFLTSGFEIYMG